MSESRMFKMASELPIQGHVSAIEQQSGSLPLERLQLGKLETVKSFTQEVSMTLDTIMLVSRRRNLQIIHLPLSYFAFFLSIAFLTFFLVFGLLVPAIATALVIPLSLKHLSLAKNQISTIEKKLKSEN